MTYEKIDLEFIIQYCKDNKQVDWLKQTAAKTTPYKVYPRTTVIDENGKKKSLVDKTKTPKIEMRPISFIQLKVEFVKEFMPEIAPKAKDKKESMYDRIAKL